MKYRHWNRSLSNITKITKQLKTNLISVLLLQLLFWWGCGSNGEPNRTWVRTSSTLWFMNIHSNPKTAADDNVFRRSIVDVVGEVLRDLQASMTERALFHTDGVLDVVNRYADMLSAIVDLNQIHFLLWEARNCPCAHRRSFSAQTAKMSLSCHWGRPCYSITEEQLKVLPHRCLPFERPFQTRNKFSLHGNLVIKCLFMKYNVLTQVLLGSPFEPHAIRIEFGMVVNCSVISVLLLQFLFQCPYFTSIVLNCVLFL